MMPLEWPIAGAAAERDKPARAGRSRLRTVRVDFFLEPAERLTEQERALMTAMLRELVADVSAHLRAGLPQDWTTDRDQALLVSTLARSGLLDDPKLIQFLLRRADEERIADAALSRTAQGEPRAIQRLISHPNQEVSAAAMGVVLARGRRRDRLGRFLVAFDDLPLAVAERLVHAIAAAMRSAAADTHGSAAADRELADAAAQLLGQHDPQRSLNAAMALLVTALERAAELQDQLLLGCAREGEAAFLAAAVGQRAGIGSAVAFEELLCGDPRRLTTTLRLASFSRELAAALLAHLGDLVGIDDAGAAIDIFDALTADDLAEARSWLKAPEPYREAAAALGRSDG